MSSFYSTKPDDTHRLCPQCYEWFVAAKPGQSYCSYECRDFWSNTFRMIDEGYVFFWMKRARRAPLVDRYCPTYDDNDIVKVLSGGNPFKMEKSHYQSKEVRELQMIS